MGQSAYLGAVTRRGRLGQERNVQAKPPRRGSQLRQVVACAICVVGDGSNCSKLYACRPRLANPHLVVSCVMPCSVLQDRRPAFRQRPRHATFAVVAGPPPRRKRCYGLLISLATLFSVWLTEVPRKVSAPMATTAIKASNRAYSTRLAPVSSLSENAITNPADDHCLPNHYLIQHVSSSSAKWVCQLAVHPTRSSGLAPVSSGCLTGSMGRSAHFECQVLPLWFSGRDSARPYSVVFVLFVARRRH